MVSHFLLSSSSPSIWGKLLFSTTDVKRSKFPRASRTKRMMTNAPKYCCCTLLLRLFHPRFWQKYQSQYYTVPMAANIPFLSPSFQLSEIEKRIFGAFSIFSWSTSEASSSSLIWASSSRRTHPLLFFGSKVGKLEKGGILRLLSSSTKARQLSSWRREQRKGEKKREKRRWDYDRRFYWRKCQTPDQSNLLMLLSSRMHSGQNFLEKFHR